MTAPLSMNSLQMRPPERGVALQVRNLTVVVAATQIELVSNASFEVAKGSVLGLVGESGCGKSTLARALLGYVRRGLAVSSGQVVIDSLEMLKLSPKELREARGSKVAYVAQDPASALNPALRVGHQIREALTVHRDEVENGNISARVTRVLREVRLDPTKALLRSYPHQLSGGQQQRVTIAMAFARRPAVIVLDEPTTGLDVTTQRHVLETVSGLCRMYGVAAVYVSHDLAVIGALASKVAVMYAGRIIETGFTSSVFSAPLHPYTRGLIAALPSFSGPLALRGIPGHVPPPGQLPGGCTFRPRCAFAIEDCARSLPELRPVNDTEHLVRCIRASEWAGSPTRGRNGLAPDNSTLETAANSVMSVSALNAYYGANHVVREVSLEVPKRQCVALVGESGSGKTTLARCLIGLHTAYTGQVSFEGSALSPGIRTRTDGVARRMQFIFQNPYSSLNPRKTVAQIVSQPLGRFWRIPRIETHRRAEAALREVSLDPATYLRKFPSELSGGEAQRVAIARALIVEPVLLICDEVTSSLDASVQAIIIELLRSLQAKRGLSMIFITHNLALVRSIAQTVLVLQDGSVVEHGSVSDVLTHPLASYTAQLLEDAPRLDAVGL